MRKFTTAAVSAALMGGIAIGSIAAPPLTALAADSSTPATAEATARTPGQWVTDALKGLVDKGAITQEQSDTIAGTLEEARPKGMGHGGHKRGFDISAAAGVVGLNESDLRTEMATKSLRQIADEKNVDVQKVIDALVAAENTRIDQKVTDGKLTQEQADEKKGLVTERVTNMVNNIRPARERGPRFAPDGEAPIASAPASTTAG